MNLDYQQLRLRLSHLSVLVEQNSHLKSFVRIVFYTSAIRNAFAFNKLPNIHFCEHFLQIIHNLRIIKAQININGEKQEVRHSRKTVSLYLNTTIGELTKIRKPGRRKNWADELWKLASAVNIGLHLVLAHKSESVIARIKPINRNRDANLRLCNVFWFLVPISRVWQKPILSPLWTTVKVVYRIYLLKNKMFLKKFQVIWQSYVGSFVERHPKH